MRTFLLNIALLFSIIAYSAEIEVYNEIYHKINTGETTEAIKLCKKQIKKDKKNPTWQYLLAEAHLHQGEYALGIETLSKLNPSRDVVRLMKNCLVADSLTKNPLPYSLTYMGDSVNTIYDNIWPTLSPAEDVFLTTVVVNNKTSFPQEDIYYSRPLNDSTWSATKPLPFPLNTSENEGSQSFSADGKYMFMVRCNQKDGLGSCDIYYCINSKNGWSKPINAGGVVNSPLWESTPSVSTDFKTLYFSSNQKPNKGGKDIFKADITVLKSGLLEFSNLKNLGEKVNTIYDETAPFIHADGVTLYFSSSGHESMGGLDVFFCRKDSNQWSKPQNMGYPLNTTRDNFGFCTNLSGEKGYISAMREDTEKSNMAIFQITLPKQFRPLPTLLVKEDNILNFNKISNGTSFSLNNILFDFNESTLLESSKKELDKLAKILTENPDLNIEIIGHTDSIGSDDYNKELSMKRAISVSNYIASLGISNERMSCKGIGSSLPLLPNNSEENRAKNRRIEFRFYSKEK